MRTIDGDALKDRFENLAYDDWNQGVSTSWADAYRQAVEIVEEMPTIEPECEEGKWIHDGYDFTHGVDWMHCSNCGWREPYVPAARTRYCPNCGVRMKEGEMV